MNGGPAPSVPRTSAAQLELDFARDAAGVTQVVRRRVRYPYTFLKPFWFDERPAGLATVLVQSGSGGLYGGERLGQRLALGAGSAVHFTTQAATVVHARRDYAATTQAVTLDVGHGAYLEHLPEPLILFPDAALEQRVEACLGPDAVLLHADGIVRHDPGDTDRPFAHYRSELTVRGANGRLLLRDRLAVDGVVFDRHLAHGQSAGWRGYGLLLVAAPGRGAEQAAWCARLNAGFASLAGPTDAGLYAACAPLPNAAGVACRIVSRDGAVLRLALERCWRDMRQALTGCAASRRRK